MLDMRRFVANRFFSGCVFGVALHISIHYANVAIPLLNERDDSHVYGHIPVIIAECGFFLRENGMSPVHRL